VLVDNIGRRLENFFWRIWSDERLRQRLSGTRVNSLFDTINEGGFIRTTPRSSPRSGKNRRVSYKPARSPSPSTPPPTTQVSNDSTPSTEAAPPSETEGSSDSADSPAVARTIIRSERLRQPEPPSSPGDIESGSVTPTPTTPLSAIELSSSTTGHDGSHRESEDSSVTPTPTSRLAAYEKSRKLSKENRRTTPPATRRPPILKKESSGSSRSSKSAIVAHHPFGEPQLEPGAGRQEGVSPDDSTGSSTGAKLGYVRRPIATRFNEEVAVSIPKFSTSTLRNTGERLARSSGESSQRLGKRSPVVVANTGASKTRPTFVRQRSSTSASKEVPSRSSSTPDLISTLQLPSAASPTASQPGRTAKQIQETASTKRSRAVSPHPSKQHRRSSADPSSNEPSYTESSSNEAEAQFRSRLSENVSQGPASKQPEPSDHLVDPDFRAKFIDRTRPSQRSFTDLPTIARKSSASVPTAASFQAHGTMDGVQTTSSAGKGKGREAFTNVTAPLKAPAPSGPEVAESQLTLLLEKEKVRSENEEGKAGRTEP
jgi:hypothetical protein